MGTIDDIKFADCIKGGMGVKANGNAKLSVKKVTYTFKSSTAGKIIWDPVVGSTSAEEQALPKDDKEFLSGVDGVPKHTIMILAAILPATFTALHSARATA